MKMELAPPAPPHEPLEVEDDSGGGDIRAGVITLVLFFGGLGGWAAFAPLDAAVVAPGVVVVAGSRQTVQHRDGGTVTQLYVEEGERVQQGEVLLELGAPELLAQERALLSQVADLQMQRSRLRAEVARAQNLERPSEWETLDQQDRAVTEEAYQRHISERGAGAVWTVYGARIIGYRGEAASLDRQEALLQQELEAMRALAADQLVPLTRVRALERTLAELQGRKAEVLALIASAQQDRDDAQRQVEARLAELAPQLVGARERLENSRVRAPVTGVIVGLSVHTIGGVVRPGDPLMDIVPAGQELIVEARVAPRDADDLELGQTTEVRLSGFGGRGQPIVHGTVSQISADRFTDQRTGMPYFTVQVTVPRDQLSLITGAANGGRQLRAGLGAEIVVPTRKRTALQYLLEPLNQSIWRSFREH